MRELAAALPQGSRSPLKALDDKAMDLASQDAELRAALFRFVDVVPACRSLDDLARHLTGFLDEVERPPAAARRGDADGRHRAGRAALGAAAAAGVRHMAHRFIVGESPRRPRCGVRALWRDGIAASVDLLGEATVTAAEADRYAARCAEALDELAAADARLAGAARAGARRLRAAAAREPVRQGLRAHAAAAPRRARARPARRRRAAARAAAPRQRARRAPAHRHGVARLARGRHRARPRAARRGRVRGRARRPGVVLQAYLRDSPETLDRSSLAARGAGRATPLIVRLVKGAYWDHEVVEARQHGWKPPVFEVKADCDRNFEALTAGCSTPAPRLRAAPAIASHNLRSVAHAIAANRARRRRRRPRAPGPARPRRRPRRARRPRSARARLLPGRRPRRRHGLPRATAAREHQQRVASSPPGQRRADRGAARRAGARA